ncbi:MAG: hypothetical protein IPK00_12355 [Deltaproteobacteria bacterium]|nr:hypothetical protein [Deltaproteobacteria bacterium]
MDLERESAPEARSLLQLARTDRRAAEKALALLPPERQAALILDTSLPIRRQVIELLPSPEAVIPLLPEAELCYTLRTIGLSDVSWLLPLATDEQLVACIDLDAWRGLRLDMVRLDAWFAALAESDDETLARAAMAMDPEVLVLYLREHIDVFVKPGPQEDPDWSPPDQSQTLEGQFYFVARKSDDDMAPLLRLLHALFQTDYWLYFRAIQAVREEAESENQGVGAALADGAHGRSRLPELGRGDADLRLPAPRQARRAAGGGARPRPRGLRPAGLDFGPSRGASRRTRAVSRDPRAVGR